MSEKHYCFFQNRDCEFFPCHENVEESDFNCLFCYCPLYTLGEACGGGFVYTEKGVNYDEILRRFPELAALAARQEKNHEF